MPSPGEHLGLDLSRPHDGVVLVTIKGRDRVNSLDEDDHLELSRVWRELDDDPSCRVIVVTGEGRAFSAGGNMYMEQRIAGDFAGIVRTFGESRDLVLNMVGCDTPIISAINGAAAGAGLAAALLADISIIGDDVVLTDGHTRIGIVAGDHATLIWPLLCGMARAKHLLLTCARITGARAAEIGLVSEAVPRGSELQRALEIAADLAAGPQLALRFTKRSLNYWLKDAIPAFEASLGMEMITLFGPDYKEGLDAFMNRRDPNFASSSPAATDVEEAR
jgi:enoyl-CoA hydratase